MKGFISLPLIGLIVICILAVTNIVAWNLERAKAHELESFKIAVKTVGDAQEAKSKAENERLKKEKENADKSLTIARADIKRLRGANSGSRNLSGATTASGVPASTCYATAELDRAYGSLVAELRAIADQGTTCALELDNARAWAKALRP